MIFIFVLILFVVDIGGLKEGDNCTKEGVAGVCANIRVCSDALQDVQNKKAPQICEFRGADPVVCCISAIGDSMAVLDSEDEAPKNRSCKTPDGKEGECVAYYLCFPNNNTLITDGVTGIDKRTRRKRFIEQTKLLQGKKVSTRSKRQDDPGPNESFCDSFLDTCCQLPSTIKVSKTCGRRNTEKNTNEFMSTTGLGEFPWTVAILKVGTLKFEDDSDGEEVSLYAGGGSLIHPSVVLTSAQLVFPSRKLRVRAGDWNTLSLDDRPKYEELQLLQEVASIEKHENYNPDTLAHNIALLFLKFPMELGPSLSVACLPLARERVPGGTRCVATGWGKDKFGHRGRYQYTLKKVEMPVVSRWACQTALRTSRLGRFFELHPSFMCAGGERGKDTCKGDGGSPLSCPIEGEEGRYMQSGIVAWGIGCGDEGIPGVYVDVSYHREWIDAKVIAKGYDPLIYTYFASSSESPTLKPMDHRRG